jgi:N-acetylmuramoyl-L-alanine amidase
VELTAKPGECYIEVNGRALYVSGGVSLTAGRTALPLRVLENALGGVVTWDDETATASLSLEGCQAGQADYDQEDLYWLSRIISAESQGESLLGQIAVGNVVLNRVKSSEYPNTIQEVVFDTKDGVQFEPVSNGTITQEPTATSVLAAKLALEGANVVGESLYFYAPALSAGSWIVKNCTYYTTIGCHRFYL